MLRNIKAQYILAWVFQKQRASWSW